jgi:hypothetical protein
VVQKAEKKTATLRGLRLWVLTTVLMKGLTKEARTTLRAKMMGKTL